MGNFKERTGKTRIGKLLQDMGEVGKPLLKVLSKVPVPGASILGDVADAIKTNSEIEEEQKQELLNAILLDMQDLANAREANTEIQKAQFSSWMAKNVPYLIDMFILIVWGCLTIFLVAKFMNLIGEVDVDLTGVLGIWGGVTGLATQIVGFHRGSSAGSRIKDIFNQK